MTPLKLYNTLSKQEEVFTPLKSDKVTMYVCGPTVYDRPHIGNGRSTVVYDVLYRVLMHKYGKDKVLFVRNITDVDDKINQRAKERGITIKEVTDEITKCFYDDIKALNCLPPNIEPKATEHISDIIAMVSRLIEKGHAYEKNGHVYFDVSTFEGYGEFAGKDLEELVAGSRVEVSKDKKNPEDFVLWKPASDDDDESSVFDSPWGAGRPGWHIECSAMSTKYLGSTFDIHGGGIDLIFPHHTNEIAQSCACYEGSEYARYWIHNGFLKVNGKKMSKSLGNFITMRELLKGGVEGEAIRFVYLTTHYRKPLNWTDNSLEEAKKSLDSFYRVFAEHKSLADVAPDEKAVASLYEDLNTPEVIAVLHGLAKEHNKSSDEDERAKLAATLLATGKLVGLFFNNPGEWFGGNEGVEMAKVESLIEERTQAKLAKDWSKADEIREQLKEMGVTIEDHKNGTKWKKL